MPKLTNRQRVFVELYLTLWNATEAAKQAGYSKKTANEQASRLLANVSVKAAVAERLSEKHATAEEVIARLTAHSRGNMDDFIGPLHRIDIDQARERGVMSLVKKIKEKTTTISKSEGEDIETHEIEIELYDAQAATVQLGKALGVFASEAPQVTVNNNLALIGIKPIEYRNGLTSLEARPIPDSDAPGAD